MSIASEHFRDERENIWTDIAGVLHSAYTIAKSATRLHRGGSADYELLLLTSHLGLGHGGPTFAATA